MLQSFLTISNCIRCFAFFWCCLWSYGIFYKSRSLLHLPVLRLHTIIAMAFWRKLCCRNNSALGNAIKSGFSTGCWQVVCMKAKVACSLSWKRIVCAGIKAEREGIKASEKSDHAVRDAADKLIHTSDKAGSKADQKTGGFFSGIGNFFKDRY